MAEEKPSTASRRQVLQIPVSLGKPSLRRRLEDYYSLIAPEIIANKAEWHAKFDLIYQKYGGTNEGEQKLGQSLAKKYGPAVRFMTSDGGSGAILKCDTGTSDAPLKKTEVWFELTDGERNSGVIDFTSDRFDPIAALSAEPSLIVPARYLKDSPIFDNIAKARVLLPDFDPQRIDPAVQTKVAGKELDSTAKAAATSEGTKEKILPILSKIASEYRTGPFSVLYRCFTERKRIKVLVRYVDCIRGTITGYIVGFDKHFNIILRDADEVYTPRNLCNLMAKKFKDGNGQLLQSNLDVEVQRRKALKHPKQEHVARRHCKQLLIRGDSVVMIWRTGDANLNSGGK